MNDLEHRAKLNDQIAADAAKASRQPNDSASKRADWHREQASFLRQQAQRRPDRSRATW